MRMKVIGLMYCGLKVFGWSLALAVETAGDKAPEGYHLVAEDDCGTQNQPHVLVGTRWLYPPDMVEAPDEHRAIVFDNHVCVLCYTKLNPDASYKADLVYVDNGGRTQRLEANGCQVHGDLQLPVKHPRRYVFDIPKASYADGKKLELKFIKVAGANAIVSYVRIWSTDETPLGALSPAERAAYQPPKPPPPKPAVPSKPLWAVNGSIEEDWILRDELRRRPLDGDWEKPETVIEARVVPRVAKHLERGEAIAADIRWLGGNDIEAATQTLVRAARARDDLLARKAFDPAAWKKVYLDVRWAVRRLAFDNPLLHRNDGLLFVRRHHAQFAHQCARRRSRYNGLGGEICVLQDLRADGKEKVVSLTKDRFPDGLFGRPDVSFDGKRIVFGFAAADVKDQVEAPCEMRGQADSIGNGTYYQVWEMGLDGQVPPRQITRGNSRREESTDPIYLPDGRIAFMSPRAGGMVQCGDWAWADCMYTMRADGSDIRQITWAKEGEWDPILMDDGSIMFTRWEYVMRFWRPTQLIWNVRPDGTNPRIISGYLTRERNYARCRQIPGTSKVVCVESHHHNDGSGNILIVDLDHGRDTAEGEKRIVLGACDCPYPISESYFLISYDPQGTGAEDRRTARQVAIYLADVYGGLELVFRDPELSAMYPMLIGPRPKPPVIPELNPDDGRQYGEFLVQDVHLGLPESMNGRARYVRIVEAHERHIHTSPCNIWVGMGGFETKTVLGTVPVEKDGSAYFRVPSGKAVFFSVLDENYQALHTMRMTTDVKPGEYVGCIGCHEPMPAAPMTRETPLAMAREPSEIEPPPWGVQTIGFPKLVQPILDNHCISCHDGSTGEDKPFDLRVGSDKPEVFVPNVWTTYEEGYKKQYANQSYWALLPHVARADIHRYDTPPGSWGSRVSPITKILSEDEVHQDIRLSEAEWRTINAWIDCNIPYLDDYRKFAVDPKIREAAAAGE